MPIYDYKCSACAKITEKWGKMVDSESVCECGNISRRIITATTIHPDFEPYLDEYIHREPIYIKSKQHRREMMKKYGVEEKLGKNWNTSFR